MTKRAVVLWILLSCSLWFATGYFYGKTKAQECRDDHLYELTCAVWIDGAGEMAYTIGDADRVACQNWILDVADAIRDERDEQEVMFDRLALRTASLHLPGQQSNVHAHEAANPVITHQLGHLALGCCPYSVQDSYRPFVCRLCG